jgi:hypothetical protein
MAYNGRQDMVVVRELLAGTEGNETGLMHVMDTSMCVFIVWFGQSPSVKRWRTYEV